MGHAVGVLADDHVALLQAQQALGLDAERADLVLRAGLHQRIPQVFAVARRHVDLVAQLADEADPQQACRDAGDRALAHRQVGEGFRAEVDVGAQLAQHVARARPGQVDRGHRRGDVGDVDVEAPLRVPLEHLLVDAVDAAGGGADVEVLLGEARAHAVVDHHAVLVGHQRVARTADRLLGEGEGVEAVEQFGGVRAAHVEAAEGGDVDQADLLAHVAGLGLHAGLALLGLAVVGRALPDAGRHHLGAQFDMALVHGGLPVRIEAAAGDVGELLGDERRARGGHPGLADAAVGGLGDQARGRQRRVAALRRAHADGGEALDQLHVAVAVAGGVDDVAHLQVLVEVDEILAVRVREDRPVVVDPRFGGEARRRGCLLQAEAGAGGVGHLGGFAQQVVEVVATVDRAGHAEVLRQAAEGEGGLGVVVAQLAAGLAEQLVDRHVAGGHAQQVAVELHALAGHLALADDAPHVDAADVAHALGVQRLVHGAAAVQRDAGLLQRGDEGGIGRQLAHVDHRGDVHARIEQVEGGQVAVVVAGQHHRALARLDRVQLDQALRGAGQHHPRQVVVAEHHRLVEGAGRDDALLGAHLVQAVALDHRQEVVGEPGVAGGLLEDLDVRVTLHRVDQLAAQRVGALAGNVEARPGQGAAQIRLLLDQQHLGAGIGGVQRGGEAGGTGADHGEVDEQEGLVVVLGLELEVQHAEAGLLADDRLPHLPDAHRLVEGAVVEADRHELGELAEQGVAVVVQRAGEVLPGDGQALGQRLQVGQHVGLAGQLHQGVGVLAGHGQRAARAVVLERARQQPAAVGEQGAGDAVALEALVRLAVEVESERLIAVDQQAHGCGQAAVSGHATTSWGLAGAAKSTRWVKISLGSKVRTISSVTVWRSARNQ
ncbi:hypothetical protein D3C78_578090 [compost metagenome]